MKNFYCTCEFHMIEIDTKDFVHKNFKEDEVSFVIYQHKSYYTGKIYKKPKELGTVVLIGKEARKFKEWINKNKKIN